MSSTRTCARNASAITTSPNACKFARLIAYPKILLMSRTMTRSTLNICAWSLLKHKVLLIKHRSSYLIFNSFILIACWFSPSAYADKLPPAAAIASAHPLATQAGFEILQAGGNAFDAAVAVSAALAVVEPTGSGLGGGGFYLLHRQQDNFQIMLDARERAPLAATKDMYLDTNGNVIPKLSVDGPLAAAIPGTPAALAHLAKQYGRLPLAKSLAPAIRYARDGFAIDELYGRLASFRLDALKKSPVAASIFLDKNEIPRPGFMLKQPDLALTIEAIAREGALGFYTGKVADLLIKGVKNAGGIWTHEDLTAYRVVERTPIKSQYRGIEIISAPPPSSGGIALATMLNILAGYDLEKMPTATRVHAITEAMRRAYRDRSIYLGDPDFVKIPIETLIHPFYADGLRASIRLDRATPSSSLPGSPADYPGQDTTHFSILDHEGNRVAATLSINAPFGSGFVAPGTGVLLNDEMDDFSAKQQTPNIYGLIGQEANAIAPGKRPLSSMSPTFLQSEQGVAILGTPGGSRIITMVLLGILEFAANKPPQDWVAAKRYHHQFLPDVIEYEEGTFSAEDLKLLEGLGHRLQVASRRFGNMQAVLWNTSTNRVSAASDPRGNGDARVAETRTATAVGRHDFIACTDIVD